MKRETRSYGIIFPDLPKPRKVNCSCVDGEHRTAHEGEREPDAAAPHSTPFARGSSDVTPRIILASPSMKHLPVEPTTPISTSPDRIITPK